MNDIDGNYLKILNGIDRAVTHGEEGCPGERKTIFDIHLLSFQASKPVKSPFKNLPQHLENSEKKIFRTKLLFEWNFKMEFERFFNEKDDRFLNDSKVNPLFDIGFIRDRNRKRKFEQIEERNPFKKRFVARSSWISVRDVRMSETGTSEAWQS